MDSESLSTRYLNALRELQPELSINSAEELRLFSMSPGKWSSQRGVPEQICQQAIALTLGAEQVTTLRGEFTLWHEFIQQIPIALCREHRFVGLRDNQQVACVAFAQLEALQFLDVVRRTLRCSVKPLVATLSEIEAAINRSFEQRADQTNELLASLSEDAADENSIRFTERDDLLDAGDKAPVIQLVNSLLFEAVRSQCSDVHIQPRENHVAVRMRIDGILFDVHALPKHVQEEVITRVKVLGRMNIAEKRLPQDGRATVMVGRRTIDLRIASMPTNHGERVVIRLLDKSARLYTLEELGMDAATLTRFRTSIRQEHGLILVTGPTGSGKSTTLYASLMEIDTTERNAVTLEDPIEYELEGISQTQINTRKGMTFASGLRSVLRQDPDIIMLGEIRDEETAVMAIQSSLTGHMVFSTLHTNDAASAVTRLLDLGIEPYLASSSLLAVLAQRLVRRICTHCKTPMELTESMRSSIDLPPDVTSVFRGTGCSECRSTGYRGRFGVFELLTVTDHIQSLITQRATAAQIRMAATKEGLRPMRFDGIAKVMAGQTTVEEVVRVTVENTYGINESFSQS